MVLESLFAIRIKTKTFICPNGRLLKCQGYEPFALTKLLEKDNINEDDIIVNRTNVPEIWYNTEDGKKHRYFVDIYIPSQNKMIEVKSSYTVEQNKEIILQLNLIILLWANDNFTKITSNGIESVITTF